MPKCQSFSFFQFTPTIKSNTTQAPETYYIIGIRNRATCARGRHPDYLLTGPGQNQYFILRRNPTEWHFAQRPDRAAYDSKATVCVLHAPTSGWSLRQEQGILHPWHMRPKSASPGLAVTNCAVLSLDGEWRYTLSSSSLLATALFLYTR